MRFTVDLGLILTRNRTKIYRQEKPAEDMVHLLTQRTINPWLLKEKENQDKNIKDNPMSCMDQKLSNEKVRFKKKPYSRNLLAIKLTGIKIKKLKI